MQGSRTLSELRGSAHGRTCGASSAAYGEFFGTPANPTKLARSTVGVAALVNADWLIEIDAFAVVP